MKRKGFTLIELLAVIVILAIIALIATPMILGVIDTAKKGAAESSAVGYINAVEQYYVSSMMENAEFPVTIHELNEVVEVKGTKPSRGTISFVKEGVVGKAVLCINNFYVDYNNGKAKVNTEKSCNEIENLPNQPKLESNMIPVIYENGTWVKASNSNWYDYSSQKWANAVTVSDTNRATYLSTEAGTEIQMDDINLMLVWIPRYEYKVDGEFGKGGTSASNPGEIEVQFMSGRSKTATSGYTVHSGFTFGSEELTGLWIGKFETSATEILNTIDGDDVDTKSIIVKPNVKNWGNQRVATAFIATRKMELANNPYGFTQTGTTYNTDGSITGDSNKLDTHMAKNTEWTAVAYLSQSKYGKYGNPNYTGTNKEVYMNHNSEGLTGCSSGVPNAKMSASCTITYDKADSNGSGAGVGASTTGTIYGVYDMNGGGWERVMANYNYYTGNHVTHNSGFNGSYGSGGSKTDGIPFPNEKYYDFYGTIEKDTACNNKICIGQNLNEAVGWYEDNKVFVSAAYPWLARGADQEYGAGAGVFAIGGGTGRANTGDTFRIIVTIL